MIYDNLSHNGELQKIAIYGFGGLGREVACIISHINREHPTWQLVGFFDDGVAEGSANRYGTVIGGIDKLNAYPERLAVVVAIASSGVIQKIISNVSNHNVYFPNIIAPNVLFFDRDSVEMGQGNILAFGCRVSCGVSIGNFNIINGCCSFGHDSAVGDFNVFQPDVRVSGASKIGNSNFFGVRGTVLQCLSIGNYVRIGAGSVVMRNAKDGNTYFGNPAKLMKI